MNLNTGIHVPPSITISSFSILFYYAKHDIVAVNAVYIPVVYAIPVSKPVCFNAAKRNNLYNAAAPRVPESHCKLRRRVIALYLYVCYD